VSDVRVFKSRTSDGVRGMKLGQGDHVISLSILHGVEATPEERAAYLKIASLRRRAGEEESEAEIAPPDSEEGQVAAIALTESRVQELAEAEQFILTITENGFGKRTSAYEYRVIGRGGSGIVNIVTSARNGAVIASFPVTEAEQIMLMTNRAKLIRTPVADVRIAGRSTQGVTILRTHEQEKVVAAIAVQEAENEGDLMPEIEE
jgi:DNA gyrase subunit A